MGKRLFKCLSILVLFVAFNVVAEEIVSKYGVFNLYTQSDFDNYKASIESSGLDDTGKKAQFALLGRAKELHKKLFDLREEMRSFDELKHNGAERLETLQRKFEEISIKYKIIEQNLDGYDSLQLNAMQEQLTQRQKIVQSRLAADNADFINVQTFPSRAPNLISENNEKIKKLSQELDKATGDLEEYVLRLEIYVIDTNNNFLQQKLLDQAMLEDIANFNLKITTIENEYVNDSIRQIQTYINQSNREKNRENSPQNYDSSSDYVQALQNEVDNNTRLESLLEERQEVNVQLTREQALVNEALQRVKQINKNLDDQLEALSSSLVLSKLLNREQSEIPNIKVSQNLDELIPDLNIWIYDLRNLREEIFDVRSYVATMIDKDPNLADYKSELELIIKNRRELYDRLYSSLSTTLTKAINLRTTYSEYLEISSSVNTTINDQLFWLASNQPLNLDFAMSFFPNIKKAFISIYDSIKKPGYWNTVLDTSLKFLFPLLLLGIFIKLIKSLLVRYDNKLAMRLDKATDGLLVTPLALFNKVFIAIPRSSWLVVIGTLFYTIILDGTDNQILLAAMLTFHITVFIYFIDLLRPNSLIQRHFNYSPTRIASMRYIIQKVYITIIPIIIVANIREIDPTNISNDILGYSIIMVFSIGLIFVAFNYIKGRLLAQDPSIFKVILALFYIAIPIGLVIMLALGYYYTAIKLINRMAYTFYICMGYVLVANLIKRELHVMESKLVRDVRSNKKEGLALNLFKQKITSNENASSKAFRLINILLLTFTAYLFYIQWQDLAGVLSYLDTINIYSSSSIVDGQTVVTAKLTLGDILAACFIMLVTVVLNRNLPSLLERLFLLKQTVAYKSTSYTVKIISSYIIITIGIIFAAGSLGVAWENLQWLVAALSVGLGFGLQEIFANFVSGLIILFERQIRVGDVITLNDLSGRVNRIRIRATTIISFDNKEVMIPNREFITTALTNWSLTNTITMLEFTVGIAYDADVDKAKAILNNIVRNCEYLSQDQKYRIYVKSLDASCVTIMCEVFVKEIALRKNTYDYLSSRTLKLFSKAGIEIPFNQMDVYIKNVNSGQEVKIDTIKG